MAWRPFGETRRAGGRPNFLSTRLITALRKRPPRKAEDVPFHAHHVAVCHSRSILSAIGISALSLIPWASARMKVGIRLGSGSQPPGRLRLVLREGLTRLRSAEPLGSPFPCRCRNCSNALFFGFLLVRCGSFSSGHLPSFPYDVGAYIFFSPLGAPRAPCIPGRAPLLIIG